VIPLSLAIALLGWLFGAEAVGTHPDVASIIDKSVAANRIGWNAAPDYSYSETDRDAHGSRTFRIHMIEGSPYQELIAVNGVPLQPDERSKQEGLRTAAASMRRAESSEERNARIGKYQKQRRRDSVLMEQLTEAFDFKFVGEKQVGPYRAYVLKATPRKGYVPPNMESQVLPGMQGELWIDQETFQWIKVTARVMKPVSIEGFLARVEPGTYFELANTPVEGNVWLPQHYVMKSRSKILFVIGHETAANETYFDYRKAQVD